MGQTKCPQSKVTCGVGNSPKDEFDSFDQLMDHVFTEAVGGMSTLVTDASDNV